MVLLEDLGLYLVGFVIFVSALINRVIKDGETIMIKPRKYDFEHNLGVFLEKGTVILDGDVGMNVGYGLRGGKLIIRGNVDYCYGNCMEKGELTIEGKVKGPGFNYVKGGKGVIRSIDEKGWSGYGVNGIGYQQQGGLIEILCNVPTIVQGIGWEQKDGELRIHGNVSCRHINYGQIGGKTHIKGNVTATGDSVLVGNFKEGGETIIDGDCIETAREGYAKMNILVGFLQKGGLIHVKGNVQGNVAYDGYPNAEIIIEKDVQGNVGDYNTTGPKITIKGNVTGSVGDGVKDFDCTIYGNVHGNVGSYFGNYSSGKRDGRIEVKGSVYGNVGEGMHSGYMGGFANCEHSWPRIYVNGDVTGTAGSGMQFGEIHVKGRIGRIGESFGGKVYNNGLDVTIIPLGNKFINWLKKKIE